MAKISARGATEVCRVTVRRPNQDWTHQWLLRSDGAVLRKTDIPGDGWTLIGKPGFMSKNDRCLARLKALAESRGYEVVDA